MPLIIETYFYPYTKIANVIFPGVKFEYIDHPISEPEENAYFYTREYISREIKYYFDQIYYIADEKIVMIHKKMKRIKYYDMETGKLINFEKSDVSCKQNVIDKSEFLPQLKAQEGDLVIFPESDEEI